MVEMDVLLANSAHALQNPVTIIYRTPVYRARQATIVKGR